MVTIFLSYSRRDEELARRIAQGLKNHSIKVWFDEWEIKVGHSISQMIERGLGEANFVGVLLTSYSVQSGWVDKEWRAKIGEEAEKRTVIILPIMAEKCRIPLLLRDKKYADFVKGYDSGFKELLDAIKPHTEVNDHETRSGIAYTVKRIGELPIGGIPMPCFFPSISSAAKNTFSPFQHLEIIVALKYPNFLISAYDIFHATRKDRLNIIKLLDKASSQGQIIFLDSGLYEKKWLRARNWPKDNFHEILRSTPCHLSFCYDYPNSKGIADQIALTLTRSIVIDKKRTEFSAINPLIHAQNPADFPIICSLVATELNPVMIAVPERELGEGVIAIAKTICSIRKKLNESGRYYPIHIVGTGNPLSILIYAACGADSFDGLDWCQTVVDHTTGCLYHSLQLDFFAHQTAYAAEVRLPYLPRALAHNLLFYPKWMEKIKDVLEKGIVAEMISKFVPPEIHSKVLKLLPRDDKSKLKRIDRKGK